MTEGCSKLPDHQQRRSSARQIWVVFSAARSVGYLRTEVVHGNWDWRPIVVNKMHKYYLSLLGLSETSCCTQSGQVRLCTGQTTTHHAHIDVIELVMNTEQFSEHWSATVGASLIRHHHSWVCFSQFHAASSQLASTRGSRGRRRVSCTCSRGACFCWRFSAACVKTCSLDEDDARHTSGKFAIRMEPRFFWFWEDTLGLCHIQPLPSRNILPETKESLYRRGFW